MAIYEISHIFDERYFRKDRLVIIVGNKQYKNVICECNFKDNISEKNAKYCELTAIYAIYKNISDSFYGIEHYRRYFCNIYGKEISEQEVKKIIDGGKIILPIPNKMLPNNFLNYSIHHHAKDLEVLRDIIISDYRDYFSSFERIMFSKKLCCFNMIICDEETFHNYCRWLFEILEKLERQININDYSAYQSRVFGFISERLLNVWIDKNVSKDKIVYRYVFQSDKDIKNYLKIFIRTIIANF